MPRKQRNLPVKVRRGELSVHPASEDGVLEGDFQDQVDRENFSHGKYRKHTGRTTREPIEPRNL